MQITQPIKFRNPLKVQHIRNGKVIGEYDIINGVTIVGANYVLETSFRGGAASTTWYLGLVDNTGFSAFAAADTMSSHAGWSESTAYTQATRVSWGPAAAASSAISNTTTVDFTINSTITIKGIFVVDNSTKSGTTGTLWATAAFSSPVSLVTDDVLKVTYSVTIS